MESLLLVHRSPIVRQGARRILENQTDLLVTNEASTPSEGFEHLESGDPDMVVTGLIFPEASGLRFISDICSHQKDVPTLVLSHYEERGVANQVIRTGARGYCRVTVDEEEFVRMIRRAADGHLAVSEAVRDEVLRRIAMGEDPSRKEELDKLSNREMQVFELLGNGYTVTEIGDILKISSGTVYTYQSRIQEKLSCENSTKLLWRAITWVERGYLSACLGSLTLV